MFNDESEYNENRVYTLQDGSYIIKNVPEDHPIAILNSGLSNITYAPVNDSPIVIKVSGGQFSSPYYFFTDETGNNIDMSTYEFMRGRTYRFESNGISSSHPFEIRYNKGVTQSNSITGTGNSIQITMANDDNSDSYFRCNHHSGMRGNLLFMYSTVGGNEYNFYHGDVNIIVNGDFGQMSVYCYNHGYMGGENLLRYSSG